MFLLKLLVVVFCCCYVYASESSEELAALIANPVAMPFLREAIKKAYNEDKLDTILDMISVLKEEIENVTLVGSQNIYGANGETVEIRTVELHWPKVPKKGKRIGLPSFDDSDDDDDDISIAQAKELFNLTSALGFELNVGAEEWNKKGELVEKAYISNQIVYEYSNGIQNVNKTIEVDTYDTMENAINKFKKNFSSVSVYKFNDQFNFIPEGSHIVPEHVAKILSSDGETNQKLFEDILTGLATLFLEHGRDHQVVPGKLAEYLQTKYPNSEFYVTSNEPKAWHLTQKDFFRVGVEYDLAAWDSGETILYNVFGVPKNTIKK